MSIMRMRKFFSKPLKVGKSRRTFAFLTPAGIVFVLLIIVLLVGTYYSFGGPPAGDDRRLVVHVGHSSVCVSVRNGMASFAWTADGPRC